MGCFEESKAELTEILRGFGEEAKGLYSVGAPMLAKGLSEDEIVNLLISLGRKKIIELLPDNRVRVLAELSG
ncbi:hypothetical protein [Rhizobium sp. Root1204]|uniref:hypothetical protein n=1 Tax=Rhizobium sp. Root1204 TaxID=1736428 RepID=UPI000712F10F|nr:hypothetical protein [Rhizobium sp. Root1204]KQV41532.1 hypothetical protein ASC96_17095 [Rhizobium sp. Root1204]